MEIILGKVYFFKDNRYEKGCITHDLNLMHVSSIENGSYGCSEAVDRTIYEVLLRTSSGHRKLYFKTYDEMHDCIELLHQAQSYNRRID